MFRQILVHSDDADFQRFFDVRLTQSVQHYHLLRMTYGLAPAPYLAIRVLRQLVQDEGDAFLVTRPICENSIYVDDALFGVDDIATFRDIREQFVALMCRGGFPLRK